MIFMAAGWWKLLNAVTALAFLAAGVVAFVHPGRTFAALAAIFSFFLIFAGTFDIIMSIAARHQDRGLVAATHRRDHRGVHRLLGRRLLREECRPAHRLGGGVRDHPRREGLCVLAFRVRELQHA